MLITQGIPNWASGRVHVSTKLASPSLNPVIRHTRTEKQFAAISLQFAVIDLQKLSLL